MLPQRTSQELLRGALRIWRPVAQAICGKDTRGSKQLLLSVYSVDTATDTKYLESSPVCQLSQCPEENFSGESTHQLRDT